MQEKVKSQLIAESPPLCKGFAIQAIMFYGYGNMHKILVPPITLPRNSHFEVYIVRNKKGK